MSSTPIPKARDDDPEDVSWALSTAATSFARGDRAEALKWLRRAAEAASEAESDGRALELAKAAAELSPPSLPPPSKPLMVPSAPSSKPLPRAAKSKKEPRKSLDKTQPQPTELTEPPEWNDTTPRPERTTHPGSPADPDAWPTESMPSEALEALPVYGQERTRIGTIAYRAPTPKNVRAAQAVRVVLWRGPDGSLRVAAQGTPVSAVTIEATLVADEPDVDLLAWLTPI